MGLRDRIAGEAAVGRSNDDDGDGVSYYRKRLLEEVNLSEIAELSSAQRRARLERVVGRMVSREGPVLSTAERTRLIRARDRRGDRPRRARAAARRPVGHRDHGQRPRRGLPRAQRPPRARRHHLHRRGPALPDDRPHRVAGEPPRRRVEPDGRRPPAHRRARQRDHPAARAARADDDDPALPAPVHARPADRDELDRRADARSCCARSSRASSTSSSPAAPAPARRRC